MNLTLPFKKVWILLGNELLKGEITHARLEKHTRSLGASPI